MLTVGCDVDYAIRCSLLDVMLIMLPDVHCWVCCYLCYLMFTVGCNLMFTVGCDVGHISHLAV